MYTSINKQVSIKHNYPTDEIITLVSVNKANVVAVITGSIRRDERPLISILAGADPT